MFVCVIWKQNPILRRNNIVLNVKFHFAGELRGFAHCVCFFGFVCRVLRIWGMLSENVCKQLRKTVTMQTLHLGAWGREVCQLTCNICVCVCACVRACMRVCVCDDELVNKVEWTKRDVLFQQKLWHIALQD